MDIYNKYMLSFITQFNSLILSKPLPRIIGMSRSGVTLSNYLFKLPVENRSLNQVIEGLVKPSLKYFQ